MLGSFDVRFVLFCLVYMFICFVLFCWFVTLFVCLVCLVCLFVCLIFCLILVCLFLRLKFHGFKSECRWATVPAVKFQRTCCKKTARVEAAVHGMDSAFWVHADFDQFRVERFRDRGSPRKELLGNLLLGA